MVKNNIPFSLHISYNLQYPGQEIETMVAMPEIQAVMLCEGSKRIYNSISYVKRGICFE